MTKKIIIFPFGGNAREALLSILAINKTRKEWDVIGFVDDEPSTWKKECCGVKVLGDRSVFKKYSDSKVLAVPGNPDNYLKRESIIEGLGVDSARFATIIDPSVKISPDAKVGYNTVLMPNIVITCGVNIGNHCVVLPNTSILHDSNIGDYCLIGSNVSIAGKISIGSTCYIGSGTRIRENTSVGERTLTGMGSNIISDVEEGVVVVGNPARVMRKVKE